MVRVELPDRFCRGIEVPHPDGKGKRYFADPRNPGSVVVENAAHARMFQEAVGGYASVIGATTMFNEVTAETKECPLCGCDNWGWVSTCARCKETLT